MHIPLSISASYALFPVLLLFVIKSSISTPLLFSVTSTPSLSFTLISVQPNTLLHVLLCGAYSKIVVRQWRCIHDIFYYGLQSMESVPFPQLVQIISNAFCQELFQELNLIKSEPIHLKRHRIRTFYLQYLDVLRQLRVILQWISSPIHSQIYVCFF